jgi:putative endonuclease
MRRYFVYMLYCSDHSYYTGITNDLERRLAEHQTGYLKTAYTYIRRPVELVFYEEFNDPMMAIEFEKQVKGWCRKKKEALIEQNWDKLKLLSECKNRTSHKYFKENKL